MNSLALRAALAAVPPVTAPKVGDAYPAGTVHTERTGYRHNVFTGGAVLGLGGAALGAATIWAKVHSGDLISRLRIGPMVIAGALLGVGALLIAHSKTAA